MPDKPNLDLINMVQKARMQHDAEAIPSQVDAVYWIEAKSHQTMPPTPRAGEWVITTDAQHVDALWLQIKAATEAGELGYKAKVATTSRTGDPNHRVIVVRTLDADDTADVERVHQALIQLGISADQMQYARVMDSP